VNETDALQTRPGQYISRTEGGPGELQQALRWVFALFWIRAATVASVAWAAFVLGPTASGALALGALAVAVLQATGEPEDVLDPGGIPRNVSGVILALLATGTVAWLAWGGEWLEGAAWPKPFGWEPYRMTWYWQLALLVPTGVWLSMRSLADWRLSNEVTDPNWTAPINPRSAYYGPARPDTEWDVPPDGVESPPEPRGNIVRPVPVKVGNGGPLRMPRQEEIGRALKGRLDGVANSPSRPLKNVRVQAPDGGTVRYSDLVTFARLAPDVGATYSSWDDRWDHAYWGSVVDVCAVMGIVSEREEKKKTRILVDDPAQSLARLAQLIDGDGHA
jgi:hypothetical protein